MGNFGFTVLIFSAGGIFCSGLEIKSFSFYAHSLPVCSSVHSVCFLVVAQFYRRE